MWGWGVENWPENKEWHPGSPREKVFQEVGDSQLDKVLLRDGHWEVISLSTTPSSVLKAQLRVILLCLSSFMIRQMTRSLGPPFMFTFVSLGSPGCLRNKRGCVGSSRLKITLGRNHPMVLSVERSAARCQGEMGGPGTAP